MKKRIDLFVNLLKWKLLKEISDYIAAPVLKRYYQFKYRQVATAEKIIWVYPSDIYGWYRGNRYDEITFEGQIKGGNWRLKVTEKEIMLKRSNKYKGLMERFIDKKPWIDTCLFKERYSKQIKDKTRQMVALSIGGFFKKNITLRQLEQYYERYHDKLFENIKTKGFLPSDAENPDITPMYVCIGPEGELLWTDGGNHRLFIAMIIKTKKIPVKVLKRHKEWQNKRELLLSKQNINLPSNLEGFRNHPDIADEMIGHEKY